MGNKSLCNRKFDHTRDYSRQIDQRKELYRRKKQEHANIEEINDDNVNRDFRQEEVQPGICSEPIALQAHPTSRFTIPYMEFTKFILGFIRKCI